ncbi:hypothetical protein NQZ68_007802 [Dissostichus eleginoides]|nr:hypothetical protein NQZ68_039951 [Dissostichus eleginoides]KAI9521485.1 hypothetical protein NQZ68_007802 [Dissostichus eleginoides]
MVVLMGTRAVVLCNFTVLFLSMFGISAEQRRGRSRDGELLGSQFSPASGFPKACECRFKEKNMPEDDVVVMIPAS